MKAFLARIFGISKTLWDWFFPLLRDQTARSLERLLPIALDIVVQLAMDQTKTGAQKRDIATSTLREAAISEGITAANSLINLAVEMAVTRMKEELE